MRGSPRSPGAAGRRGGSIPTCAGEPGAGFRGHCVRPVYPHVCGGALPLSSPIESQSGLSPRVRGSHSPPQATAIRSRSIPTCAGEPLVVRSICSPFGVYPHVCGGAFLAALGAADAQGLSPRVRGSLSSSYPCSVCNRSIPTCAGEPRSDSSWLPSCAVYPHVCGGAYLPLSTGEGHYGLSPRVRGSRSDRDDERTPSGSIPTCAGEPQLSLTTHVRPEVYPHVCGGACLSNRSPQAVRGLSPRVRGSHFVSPDIRESVRSIPTCAGEPASIR